MSVQGGASGKGAVTDRLEGGRQGELGERDATTPIIVRAAGRVRFARFLPEVRDLLETQLQERKALSAMAVRATGSVRERSVAPVGISSRSD